jgi:RNA polymerase sigma-70 factor (ECF subfamily)
VSARRPRIAVSRSEQQQVVERFLAAVTTGDLQGLMDVLAPDVVAVADGGGLARAFRHPVEGADRVAALLSGFPRLAPGVELTMLLINGAVAVRIDPDGEFDTALNFAIENGRISRIYAVRNPHKLGRLAHAAELRR